MSTTWFTRARTALARGSAPVPRRTDLPRLTWDQKQFWMENGYLVLPAFFSRDEVDRLDDYVEGLWAGRRNNTSPIVVDYFLESPKAGRSLLRDTPEAAQGSPYKLNDLYLDSEIVRDVAMDAALCALLGELLEGTPMACNTLNFERGSQQANHFDTFFMPSPVPNKMLATWVALEDIAAETGPLQYYPRSPEIQPYRFSHGELWATAHEMPAAQQYMRHMVDELRLEKTTFLPQKGDVFVWHAQLMHGGSPIGDLSKTRKSLVTHYFRAEDFDVSARATLPSDVLRQQHQAMGPSWRPHFLTPNIRTSAHGQLYLDKWAPTNPIDLSVDCG